MLRHVRRLILVIICMLSLVICGCSVQTTDTDDTNPVTNSKVNTTASSDGSTAKMQVHYIDVGQGDAILVQSAGQNMLIDAGDNEHASGLVEYLKSAGVQKIDILVGTHPHADHIGGMDAVLQAFPVKAIYLPRVAHTSKSFQDVLDAVEAQNLKISTAKAGVSLPLTDIKADILAPVKDSYEDLNNYSAVIRVICGNKVFLFMGDAEKEAEADILNSGVNLKADVLKVGHHGSDSGTSEALLMAVKPQYAIIMVGAGNPYGHPHQETLTRLTNCSANILRTDLNGTIVISTDGSRLQIKTDK